MLAPIIPATWEAEEEIATITVQDQPWQEASETSISINKIGTVANTYNPSYKGSHRRISV
jgi:hypothetical protein